MLLGKSKKKIQEKIRSFRRFTCASFLFTLPKAPPPRNTRLPAPAGKSPHSNGSNRPTTRWGATPPSPNWPNSTAQPQVRFPTIPGEFGGVPGTGEFRAGWPIGVNLGRKSWSEKQLARARATSAFVLARQPAQPGRQSLQRVEQLVEVLQRLRDLGRKSPHTPGAPVRADPTERATTHRAMQQGYAGYGVRPSFKLTRNSV